jgi:hypothetical protein
MRGAGCWIYLDKLHLLHLLDGNRTLLDDLGGDGLGGDGLCILLRHGLCIVVRDDGRESLLNDLSRKMNGGFKRVSGQCECTCIQSKAWWTSITPGGGDEGIFSWKRVRDGALRVGG